MHAELHPFRLGLKAPLVTGGVTVGDRAGILVSLSADGLVGWGEASPLPGWSRTSLHDTETALRRVLDGPGGLNAHTHGDGEPSLDSLLGALHRIPHARAAVAGAWTDLEARREGHPLAQHLLERALTGSAGLPGPGAGSSPAFERTLTDAAGFAGPGPGAGSLPTIAGTVPGSAGVSLQQAGTADGNDGALPHAVAVNALVSDAQPSLVQQQAQRAASEGFAAVKLKVAAADPAVDVERVRAARSGLGPAGELRLDANGAWDASTALQVLDAVQDCDIAYCEEPVAGIEEMAALASRSPVPFAVDESMRDQHDAARALDLGLNTLIVKPQALGGPDIALAVAARAREVDAAVIVTSFLDSAVGVAHALHVAAAVDAVVEAAGSTSRRAHGLATSGLLAGDVAIAPPVVDGYIAVPAAAGLGIVPSPRPAGAGD